METGRGFVQELLAGLKVIRTGLKNRLTSSVRAVWPVANRESSAWLALRAEYGPDEPIIQAIDSDMHSVGLQHDVDHHFYR
jgi:hypothetical protein